MEKDSLNKLGNGPSEDVETFIKRAFDEGDLKGTATLTLETYGPELMGFLAACHRRLAEAEEVFSRFSEDFWRGLPDFKWRCSMRTWVYTLARNADRRYRRYPHKSPGRHVALKDAPEVIEAIEKIRTGTATYLQTGFRNEVKDLRAQLTLEQQEILILRLDRGLSWRNIAFIMQDENESEDEAQLRRRTQTLRKRYDRIKEKLRRCAEQSGMLDQ
ncbi:MAG: sigma-70 family RNA polymerase sigma factor [Proteobacteria bacterium]|nr:sigma-70 family RNA polymerase sigma factor [Pseudomonadota bacterium]